MALSATISVSPASVTVEQSAVATVVISNSGGSAVLMTSCLLRSNLTGTPAAKDATSAAFGDAPLSAGFPISVPASGSLTLRIPVIYHQPSGLTTFDLSANIESNDGSNFSPTAATITVTPIVLIDAT